MSEVVQPLIFPVGELEERWKLRKLIEHVIVFDSTNPVFEKLDAKIIKDVFEVENGGTVLTAAAVSNMLYAGGYTKEETGGYAQINGGINFQAFNALQQESKLLLVHCMQDNNPKAAACRKIMLAERTGQEIEINENTGDVSIGGNIDWIRVWLEFFTISKFNKEPLTYAKVKWKPDKRASIVTLYNFYCNVLRYYGKQPVTRKIYRQYLEQLGIKFKKGYANHTSGVLYAEGLWIPTTSKDQQKSIEVGYAVINHEEGSVITPYGTRPVDNLLDRKVVVWRRFGYDEPQEPKIENIPVEISGETVDNGRDIEVRKDAPVQEETRIETPTEIVVGDNGCSVEKIIQNNTEDAEAKIFNRTSEDAVEDTTSAADTPDEYDEFTETSYATLKARDPNHKPKAFVDYDPLDTAASAAYLNGTEDAGDEAGYEDDGDWEDDSDDTVTVETVLTALRVANKIQPINTVTLDYWLNRMHTSLDELGVTATQLINMI